VQQASVIASYRGRLLSAHTAQNAIDLRCWPPRGGAGLTVRDFPSARDLPRDSSESSAQPENPAQKAGRPGAPREPRRHQP
jgi:hypothetical protein